MHLIAQLLTERPSSNRLGLTFRSNQSY